MSGQEKGLENGILEYLRALNIWCQKVHSGSVFVSRGPHTYKLKLADQGTPDIIACVKGKLVGIEVKKDQAEVDEWEAQWRKHLETKQMKTSWERSIFQHTEHQKIIDSGGTIIICSDLGDLEKDIKTLLSEP